LGKSESRAGALTYRIVITPQAQSDLKAVEDQRSQKAIASKIDDLQTEPEKRGKPLTEDLKGYYSVRAAGQRYRVIYQVQILELEPPPPKRKDANLEGDGAVIIEVIGIRKEGSKKDAYEIAHKRLGKK
jgi:mRNA interferase RelE/StbE